MKRERERERTFADNARRGERTNWEWSGVESKLRVRSRSFIVSRKRWRIVAKAGNGKSEGEKVIAKRSQTTRPAYQLYLLQWETAAGRAFGAFPKLNSTVAGGFRAARLQARVVTNGQNFTSIDVEWFRGVRNTTWAASAIVRNWKNRCRSSANFPWLISHLLSLCKKSTEISFRKIIPFVALRSLSKIG